MVWVSYSFSICDSIFDSLFDSTMGNNFVSVVSVSVCVVTILADFASIFAIRSDTCCGVLNDDKIDELGRGVTGVGGTNGVVGAECALSGCVGRAGVLFGSDMLMRVVF